jgi:spore coat polysaccharide biosynthesis protein SpsF
MLEVLIERLERVPEIDEIVVATTAEPEDDAIEALARQLDVGCFRGSSDDVLDRVLRAAQAHGADVIVEITGDCPLIDPPTVREVIALFRTGGYDYVSNIQCEGYPRGLDTQVFPTRVLAEVASLTQDPADREHVSLYIYEHPERYRLGVVETPADVRRRNLRLTVDTPEDLELVDGIYERLYPVKPDFTLDDVVAVLDAHPELAEINADIRQKALR